jgi:hypothetical protein
MMASKDARERARVKIQGRKNVEGRRRSRQLTPGVIGICLTLILSSSLVLVASPAKAAGSSGPNLPGGDWVGFSCPKGYISLASTQICSNGFSNIDACGSSSCQASLVASMDSGYTFGSWETAGDASVVCPTCSSTTLKTSDPGGGRYSGSVSECVAGPVSFSITPTAQATNVTFSFEPTLPAGCSTPVTVSLNWGPTTSYQFTAISNGQYTAGTWYSVLIDYLQPSTTYYYKFTGTSPCCTQGAPTGLWTTGSEQTYYNSFGITMRGFVHDQYNNPAPSGVYVAVKCTSGDDYYYSTTTGSQGAYKITVSDELGRPACTADNGYYAVEVLTQPQSIGISGLSTQWNGYWNETIEVWDPQFVNFYTPANFLGPMTPLVLDFTNDAYVSFDYQSTFYSTTTSCWTFLGQQQCASGTTSNLVNLNSAADNNLEYYGEFNTAGWVEFNAISSRSVQTLSWSYIGQPVVTNQQSNIVSDWVTPFFTGLGSTEVCYTKGPGQSGIYSTSYSQSYQLSSSFDLDFSYSLDLGAGASVGTSVPIYSNSISNGGGSSWTMSYTISVPQSGSTTNVWVYVQPGTTNQVGPVVHAWSGPAC